MISTFIPYLDLTFIGLEKMTKPQRIDITTQYNSRHRLQHVDDLFCDDSIHYLTGLYYLTNVLIICNAIVANALTIHECVCDWLIVCGKLKSIIALKEAVITRWCIKTFSRFQLQTSKE